MSENSKNSVTISSGVGFPLFLVFLVLKLTNTIDWNWFWIVSPLLLPVAFIVLWLVLYIIVSLFDKRYWR